MNQALSERTWFRAALAGCLAALALIFCTSCKTERKLSVPESSPLNRPASANDYVKGLIDRKNVV